MAVGKVGKGHRSSGRAKRTKNRHDTKRMTERKPSGEGTLKGGFVPDWEREQK